MNDSVKIQQVTPLDSTSAKFQLRKSMRQILRALDADSSKVCTALDAWLLTQHSALHTIAVYSPLLGEVDLSASIQNRPDLDWVYPKVRGEDLTFHLGKILIPGAFGILEPADGAPEVPIETIDVFICPGLAFDHNGGRLGRGRGFYDRVLSKSRNDALKVGVCFEKQIVPNTFPENHDVPMDVVIFSEGHFSDADGLEPRRALRQIE
jgi:5-formyltetrahydrofolate cyclo-ligase